MSRVTFNNGQQEAELRGSERSWMDYMCNAIALATVGPIWDTAASPHWTRRLLPPGHYVAAKTGRDYEDSLLTWLRVGRGDMHHPETGASVNSLSVILNTAIRVGGDEVRLMARIHAQCEIHGFIPPESSAFVAGIISRGRESGLYRSDMGWEAVAELLLASGPAGKSVVMSYSVTDSFPGYDRETDEPKDWDTALASLDPTLAIREDTWKDYHFGNGDTLLSLEPRTP